MSLSKTGAYSMDIHHATKLTCVDTHNLVSEGYNPPDESVSVQIATLRLVPDCEFRGFRASMNPRFEVGILDSMDRISDFYEKFQYVLMWSIESNL